MANVKTWQWINSENDDDDNNDISHHARCLLNALDPQAEYTSFYENLYDNVFYYIYTGILTLSCLFIIIGVLYIYKAIRGGRQIAQSFEDTDHDDD